MPLTDIEQKLYDDLKTNGSQESWNWEADYRFANIIGDTEAAEMIRMACDSAAVSAHRWAVVQMTGIPKKRLVCLRKLAKMNLVDRWWIGLGEGAISEFNLKRVRVYGLAAGEIEKESK